MTVTEFAPAKVNLTLHVTGRRNDGYHLLQSLVVFAGVGDTIAVTPSKTLSLYVDGPFAAGVPTDGTNLVMRAAKLLSPETKAAIRLTKNLPHGGGIGGGSSDAAATLRALSRLLGVPLPDPSETLKIGADLPVCMHAPAPMLMSGIGEMLTLAPKMHGGHLVLVNPRVEVPTGKVFAALRDGNGLNPHPILDLPRLERAQTVHEVADWLSNQRNDLTKCAHGFAPQISTILDSFRVMDSCLGADMSGSGSTCWGLFASAEGAQTAAADIGHAHPEWWVHAAPILQSTA